MASVIEFSKLSYQHPGADAAVIQGLSLAIEAGSFVAVVGGSGVGKSTLLRAAAGLADPASGEVRFQAPARPGRRSRAVVFQDSRLMPWRTVGGNVGYGLEGLGLDRQERQQRIDAALQLTGLGDYGRRWPHQLSGGQAQRVGIARALAVKPDLLLMDEPFSAVDAITRRNLQQELIRVWQASGAAVLFVTHDIEEAVFLADKVVVLGGRPANIAGHYDIDLPRPRDRADPAFARQVAAIAHTLEHH
ncbi:ABC transporter ATP-binding protein [Achromobacter ruhlandii]|uniref:ABC transporter ATP-binding protein n=1 Tax=Achromobacter ruhlandii TaxID=72557 RepID=UPI003B9C3563